MATQFPNTLDVFVNPSATTPLQASAGLRHSLQHTNLNDSTKAIQNKIGVDFSNTNNSIDYIIKLYLLTQTQHQDGGYRKIFYVNGSKVIPTSVVWYLDNTESIKLVEKRFSYGANKLLPNNISLILYDGSDSNIVKRTINDSIIYDKLFEVSRTRIVT
jgi:hypothetical protein